MATSSDVRAPGPTGPETFRVRVLGCKVNQYEAEQIAQVLEAYGLREAADDEAPDLTVVHGCAVTAAAAAKTRQAVRRAAQEAAGGRVIATGCGAAGGDAAGALMIPPGPDGLDRLEEALRDWIPGHPAPGVRAAARRLRAFRGHARAFLKVQDGCDLGCSYCIVPTLRRAPTDKPLDEAVAEAHALARAGHRECVITGVHLGLWGRGRGGLSPLLHALAQVPGLERIRLSSLHPNELDAPLLAAWAAHPALLPHLHLPIQSGSDRVLAEMRRGHGRDAVRDAVGRARRALDRPTFSTDVLVGFPGEREADFEQTLDLCREIGFCRIHAFPYSPRPGTPAARRTDRIPAVDVRGRMAVLHALAAELARAAARAWAGQTERVLCETYRPGRRMWEGYTDRYLPAHLPGPADGAGRLINVRLARAEGDRLIAEPLAGPKLN
jgi:threonylcarbamoyladenosine tRNA methylthiotransferase MtaB